MALKEELSLFITILIYFCMDVLLITMLHKAEAVSHLGKGSSLVAHLMPTFKRILSQKISVQFKEE